MKKEVITKDDGRYIIFYTFPKQVKNQEEEEEDV